MAGDVADEEVERAERGLHDVVVVAAGLLGRLLPGGEAQSRRLGEALGPEVLLDLPRELDLARHPETVAFPLEETLRLQGDRGVAAERPEALLVVGVEGPSPFLFIASMTPTTEPDGVTRGTQRMLRVL